jgi:hypothetical protein
MLQLAGDGAIHFHHLPDSVSDYQRVFGILVHCHPRERAIRSPGLLERRCLSGGMHQRSLLHGMEYFQRVEWYPHRQCDRLRCAEECGRHSRARLIQYRERLAG